MFTVRNMMVLLYRSHVVVVNRMVLQSVLRIAVNTYIRRLCGVDHDLSPGETVTF